MYKRILSHHVNTWFQNSAGEDASPAEATAVISSLFLERCERFKLNIVTDPITFRKIMCETVCTLYHCDKYNVDWNGPHRKFFIPNQWTDEIESAWNSCISVKFFNEYFWASFWRAIPTSELFEIKNSKENLQYLLPLYVRRSSDILIQKGFLIEQEDGNIVATEDYESEDDTWDR